MVFVPTFTDVDEDKATLERVADHIEHIGKRCGRAHVGISSDFGKSSLRPSSSRANEQMEWTSPSEALKTQRHTPTSSPR